ncbi:MAG TPA: cyanophycin synthetase [Verrucomicrobiales bacterium]|nr:cyanophycin synthetase [Verrucomicrobiales bacterium]
MEIRSVYALRGPNIWASFPVLEAWVDIQEFERSPSDAMPGFNERIMAWLPTMIEHRCSVGVRGGFFERLRRGTWMAHILEHVALELQSLAGTEVGFGRARETSDVGVYKVAIEYDQEDVGRAALECGRRLCLAAAQDLAFNLPAELESLRDLAQRVCLGPSTRAIVDAAQARGIPFRRLNTDSLVQFGQGFRRRRIIAAETDRTGAIAQEVAQDKDLTRRLLEEAGVPAPEGRCASSAQDAAEAAREIGFPVVVKPRDAGQGRGVAANLTNGEEVVAAYAAARRESEGVLVERFIPGADYRLLIVGERLVAAARRDPAQVIGDGSHTVRQLIEQANADPRRGDHHATALSRIHLDEVALSVLAQQELTEDGIPAAGQKVLIRRNANLSTGGTAVDVTSEVHPAVAARAIEAARVVGLDIAGVDVVASDISVPLEKQGGAVLEVNAAPGLRMHLSPSSGVPRPVGEAIVELLYPPGQNGRIPVVAVTGVNGKTTTTRFISHILRGTGARVGMTCTDGIFIDDRRIDSGDCSGPRSARAVLANPVVEMAVLETARGGILREGLGFDRCDVAVVTNIGEGDHLGLADVHDLEKLAQVKRVPVEAVAPEGFAVLNAADPLVAAMADRCPGSVLFFAADAKHPVIERHRHGGGRAVFVRDGFITLADAEQELPLIRLDRVPLTCQGRLAFQVENTLAAIGAAWALGVAAQNIIGGAEQFASSFEILPGRFNQLEFRGATVFIDYGHNPSALSAIIDALPHFSHTRRLAVYSMAGDRRDCDIVRQGELLGHAFDHVILYEDHYLRGRRENEIVDLLRQGLSRTQRVSRIEAVRGSLRAVERGLRAARNGDLVFIQADVVDETVDFVRAFLERETRRPETSASSGHGRVARTR